MSSQHSGNLLNQITFEEHDGLLNAKKVSLVSGATIYAVVNTSSGGNVTVQQGTSPWITSQQGNVTLDRGSLTGLIGNLTIDSINNPVALKGNLTLTDSKGFIGLVTTQAADPKGYIGLVTVTQASAARTITGNLTIDSGNISLKGNLTIDSGNISLKGNVTIDSIANPIALKGNVTISGTVNIAALGNLTLTDSKTFIGLVTATSIQGTTPWSSSIVGNITLSDPKGFIGLVTLGGGTAWVDPKTYIGLVTVDIGTSNSVAIKGNVTISGTSNVAVVGNVTLSGTANVAVLGNLTLSDPKNFIGLTTTVNSQAWPDPKVFIGLVTVGGIGTVTLADSKGFIGLVTSFNSYGSNSTLLTGVISATGFTTIATPPNNTRFFIKNIHVSSLGRSEVELRSGATTLIPFTSLSTTSGFAAHYGELGLPGRSQNDTLVWNLNGLATISYMINVRSEA